MTQPVKMKHSLKLALLSGFALSACVAVIDTPHAYADQISQSRDHKNFSAIDQTGSSDVVVKFGSSYKVEVQADDKYIDEILTEVEDDTLVISMKKCKGWCDRGNSKVTVTMPTLKAFSSRGSGDTEINDLKTDTIRVQQKGSGDLYLNGTCKKGSFDLVGSGDFESQSLKCDDLEMSSRGSGDIEIDMLTTQKVSLEARGSGDIELDGSCQSMTVNLRSSGSFRGQKFKCESVDIEGRSSGSARIYASKTASIDIAGSGDVDLYGGAKIDRLRSRGSGDVEVHNN